MREGDYFFKNNSFKKHSDMKLFYWSYKEKVRFRGII